MKTIIFVNDERLYFDNSIKSIVKKTGSAFVQVLPDNDNSAEVARAIRANLADITSNGDKPADVVVSGFDYDPEINASIEKFNCKLIWAC